MARDLVPQIIAGAYSDKAKQAGGLERLAQTGVIQNILQGNKATQANDLAALQARLNIAKTTGIASPDTVNSLGGIDLAPIENKQTADKNLVNAKTAYANLTAGIGANGQPTTPLGILKATALGKAQASVGSKIGKKTVTNEVVNRKTGLPVGTTVNKQTTTSSELTGKNKNTSGAPIYSQAIINRAAEKLGVSPNDIEVLSNGDVLNKQTGIRHKVQYKVQ